MTVTFEDYKVEELEFNLAMMNESFEEFLRRAIETQLRIDRVTMEKVLRKTKEPFYYTILMRDLDPIRIALDDKQIPYEITKINEEEDSVELKTYLNNKNMQYLMDCADNHHLEIRLPIQSDFYPREKMEELRRMYNMISFTCATYLDDPSDM